MKVSDYPTIISLPKVKDARGNLSFIEGGQRIPFEIERTYWLYDLPGGTERHGRALRTTYELVVAMSGCFDVTITRADGRTNRITLKRCDEGLLLPPMTWRTIDNFSSGATALTLASTRFDEADYIRDFNQYKTIIGNE
jgi:hypothetical protein